MATALTCLCPNGEAGRREEGQKGFLLEKLCLYFRILASILKTHFRTFSLQSNVTWDS